jgi:hypothetical protein
MVNGTIAIGGNPRPDWQIAGTVGVGVTVAVIEGVRAMVGVELTVPVAVAGGVHGAAQPPVVQASQQLGNPVVQLPPPLGARHLSALDFTLHLVCPLEVVRQQVTHPAGRPHVDLLTQRLTSPRQALGKVSWVTAASMRPFAHRR